MPIVDFATAPGSAHGELSLLVHLMSAGRLQLFDKRASLKDKRSRLLIRLDGRPRAASARVRDQAARLGEAAADRQGRDWTRWSRRSARRPGRRRPARSSPQLMDEPRQLHPLLRHQRTIAGIGRSWVGRDPLGGEALAVQEGLGPRAGGGRAAARRRCRSSATAIDTYEETIGETVPDKMPMPLRVHRREGEPCPRCGTTLAAVYFAEHRRTTAPRSRPAGASSRTAASRAF